MDIEFTRYVETKQICLLLKEKRPPRKIELTMGFKELSIDINNQVFIRDKYVELLKKKRIIGKLDTPVFIGDDRKKIGWKYNLIKCPLDPIYQCAQCEMWGEKYKKCSGCHLLHYCSKICQIIDWKKHHKKECLEYQATQKES